MPTLASSKVLTYHIKPPKIGYYPLFRYTGGIAHYKMRREEIRNVGYVLAVPDEVLKACKVGNVLFRVWFQVKEVS